MSGTEDVAAKAGRGTIYITASKLWFMVTGAALMFVLPRLVSVADVGVYKVVIGLVSVVNAVVVTGTIQTVSKFVSQTPEHADAIKRKALLLQVVLGGGAAAGFALAAPLVAASLNDASLTPYLRLAALITASYTFYAVFVGVLNGRKDFLRQAALDAVYSTAKVLLIVVCTVAAGYTLTGAIGGFAAAAFAVLVVAALVVGVRGRAADSPVGFGGLLQFQLALIAFLLVNNLLMKTDLLIVKATISSDPLVASAAAGAYGAALDFAYIVFQIILSITFVVFPLVSEATFRDDVEVVRGYVRETLRATLVIAALPAALFSANAAEVLRLVYPPEYVAGAPALRIVAVGMLSFAVITVLTSVISSGGRPWVSVAIVSVTLALDAGLNFALIPSLGLAGAATATTIAMFAGAAACVVFVGFRYGARLPVMSIARVALSAGAVYALSLLLPSDAVFERLGFGGLLVRVAVAAEFCLMGLVYLTALIATREIGADEWRLLRRIAGR
ncbi:MAG: oligosaccharide flippase family protein [Blastocatellia bacterium]|nr:oligosaccharide flippase family protein [Blastocatellia bacterium]